MTNRSTGAICQLLLTSVTQFTYTDRMNKLSNSLRFVLITPALLLLAHAITFFPHEYGHSFVAWLGGFKANPWLLDFGDSSWMNLLLQLKIDENVNYQPIIAGDHNIWVALIAFSGIGLNILLLIFALPMLKRKKSLITISDYFLYWFFLMNIGHIYAYVPIRTFANHADMAYITQALHISPWWLMVIIGYPLFYLIGYFLIKIMPKQIWLIITSILVLFGYFAGPPYLDNYGPISIFLMHFSWYLMPLLIFVFAIRYAKS